jgi:hypothetical protein
MYEPPQNRGSLEPLNAGETFPTAKQDNARVLMNELSDRERERLARTLEAIPGGVQNGLEIGFNDLRKPVFLRSALTS